MSLENIHKLQLIQNYAARIVKKALKRSSANLLLKYINWLSLKDRIAVLAYYTINNNSSPSYLRELITVYTHQTQKCLLSSQESLMEVPRKKIPFGELSFSHTTPEVRNKFPEYTKSSRSTAIFKNNLNTYVFR